jgi:putative ATPase
MELFPPEETRPGARAQGPGAARAPLAERMRPRSFAEVLGQAHLLAPGAPLGNLGPGSEVPSIIFWGPPGSGKTTIARLIAQATGMPFVAYSAVTSGVKEIRETIAEARARRRVNARPTLLFVDEIHRFNRAQQDAFLPHVEDGTIVLVGATTENPSFEVNSALLSRARVLLVRPLGEADLRALVARALGDSEHGLGDSGIGWEPSAVEAVLLHADGDARRALNALELATEVARREGQRAVAVGALERALVQSHLRYDKSGEEHYNLISALHKSLRDSDPDATLYWLTRMLAAGEDPLFVARRLVRAATEDVGLADPQALVVAQAAADAYHFLGSPEGELALAEAALYLACAPKSNSVYRAYGEARRAAEERGSLPVPLVIRNAVTGLMAKLGYGKGYQYSHAAPEAVVDQEHLPAELAGQRFYEPGREGAERAVAERLARWHELRARLRRAPASSVTPPAARPGPEPPSKPAPKAAPKPASKAAPKPAPKPR